MEAVTFCSPKKHLLSQQALAPEGDEPCRIERGRV